MEEKASPKMNAIRAYNAHAEQCCNCRMVDTWSHKRLNPVRRCAEGHKLVTAMRIAKITE